MDLKYTRHLNKIDEVNAYLESKEVGRFTVYRSIPFSMGIFVETEMRGLGIARRMMKYMLEKWMRDPKQMIYIDTDASSGFWDHIGMKPNPDFENLSLPQHGYEKCISVAELDAFLKSSPSSEGRDPR